MTIDHAAEAARLRAKAQAMRAAVYDDDPGPKRSGYAKADELQHLADWHDAETDRSADD